MRIELPPRRELDFQGFGRSKRRHILTQFSGRVQGTLGEGSVERLSGFGLPSGVPKGVHFGKKKCFF